MKVKENHFIGISGIVFGICNMVPCINEQKWTLIIYFITLGLPEVIVGVIGQKDINPKSLRSMSWLSTILGMVILSLNVSPYYHSTTMSYMNYIAAFGLIISGLYGVFTCSKKYGLELIP